MNSPYKGKFKVTQEYKGTTHDGLDLVGLDNKNIYSTINGVVEYAGWENPSNRKQGFGLYIRIKQNNSIDKYYFGHLSQIKVKIGQQIKIGDLIGIEGNTGYSTGSHLHYCVRGNGSKSKIKNISTISGIPNKIGTYNTQQTTANNKIDVIYQIWDDNKNKWLPNVKNLEDYAGIFGNNICAIYANLSEGNITYRVHTLNGKWLPAVTNRKDYAGIFNKPIDCIMFKTNTKKTIKYRVHLKNSKKWLPWVTGYSTLNGKNGYAGIKGQAIDAIQLYLE